MGTGYFDRVFGNYLPDDEKFYCEKCEEECSEDDLVEVNNSMVCPNCFDDAIECEICHEFFFEDDITVKPDGKWVCDSCADDNYTES